MGPGTGREGTGGRKGGAWLTRSAFLFQVGRVLLELCPRQASWAHFLAGTHSHVILWLAAHRRWPLGFGHPPTQTFYLGVTSPLHCSSEQSPFQPPQGHSLGGPYLARRGLPLPLPHPGLCPAIMAAGLLSPQTLGFLGNGPRASLWVTPQLQGAQAGFPALAFEAGGRLPALQGPHGPSHSL